MISESQYQHQLLDAREIQIKTQEVILTSKLKDIEEKQQKLDLMNEEILSK